MTPEYGPVSRPAPDGWRRRVLPTSRFGRLAGWFALAFAVWFLVVSPLTMAVQGNVQSIPVPVLIAVGWAGFGSGFVAGVLALVAILREGERAVLAFAYLVPLAIVVAFVLGEIFLPH